MISPKGSNFLFYFETPDSLEPGWRQFILFDRNEVFYLSSFINSMVEIKQRWFYSKIDIWLNNGQTKTRMDVFFSSIFWQVLKLLLPFGWNPKKLIFHNSNYSRTPIYRSIWGKRKVRGKSGFYYTLLSHQIRRQMNWTRFGLV